MSVSNVWKAVTEAAQSKVGQKMALTALLVSGIAVLWADYKEFQNRTWEQAFEHAKDSTMERKRGMDEMRAAHKEDSLEIKTAVKECTQAINRQTEIILSGRSTSKRPNETAPFPTRGDGN